MTGLRKGLSAVPRTVWTLGLVSLLMDFSSEWVHALLPVFLVGTLGASVALVGLIEGLGEATSSIVKVFSGALSDRLGARKWLTVVGYGLAALTKPIFPLATGPFEVLGARLADRLGKGVRGAPRDALIADITTEGTRGAAFGVRQAMDTAGAFLGPLVAIAAMLYFSDHIRLAMAWAVAPAALCVLLLIFGVKEPERRDVAPALRPRLNWATARRFSPAFWGVVAIGSVLTLARFSEAFLILRARDVGLDAAWAPAIMVAMNLVYMGLAAPAGAWSDRIDRRVMFSAGLVALVASDLVLAAAATPAAAIVGAALWGLHMALTQGLLSALVADTSPVELRGSGFGLFNLATGVMLLFASGIAGLLWTSFGPAFTFIAGAVFASAALAGLLALAARGRAQT